MKLRLFLLGLVLVLPAASANHALHAVYQADDLSTGCRLTLDGQWMGGSASFQSWVFTVAVSDDTFCVSRPHADVCRVQGSVEDGFAGSCVGGGSLGVTGTGHAHFCCDLGRLDIHGGIVVTFASGATGLTYQGTGGVVAYG